MPSLERSRMQERLTTDCDEIAGSGGLVDIEREGALLKDALRGLVGVFALQDVIFIGYLAVTTIFLLGAPPTEMRAQCVQRNLSGIAALVSVCVLARRATFVAPS